jgi:outer membrane biosynthesis protein TonB
MPSLDNLPADQRAVLQLVLKQGRSYDEIAKLLSIDRAGVRDRALKALDALAPQTRVPPERRALITDYLLGQLPPGVSDQTRDRLAESPSERAWARVIASELAPLASAPLPEIPADARPESSPATPPETAPATPPETAPATPPETAPATPPETAPATPPETAPATPPETAPTTETEPEPEEPRRSRRGGAILLGAGALVAVAVVAVVVIVATGGSGSSNSSAKSTPVTTTAASVSSSTTTTGSATSASSTASTKIVKQINLLPPDGKSKAVGIAQVLTQGTTTGIVIYATGIPPNTPHNAYAVWLYNSPGDAKILGFVNPGVTKDGKLQTAGAVPSNVGRYKQVLITLETQQSPKSPGPIILQGSLAGA